jgi:DNA-binding CsgD family transcriptional regulator
LHGALAPVPGTAGAFERLIVCLTPRQLDIALLVADGYQNAQVAGHLGLSERTVRNQVSNIFARLGLFSRAELALLCERAGLLSGSVAGRMAFTRVLRSTTEVMRLVTTPH